MAVNRFGRLPPGVLKIFTTALPNIESRPILSATSLRIEPPLQDDLGRDLIDDGAALPRVSTGIVEIPLRCDRREALVPQAHGTTQALTQLIGKGARFFRCRPRRPVH